MHERASGVHPAGDIKGTGDGDDEIDKQQQREAHFVCLFVCFLLSSCKATLSRVQANLSKRPVFVYKFRPYLLFSKERILSLYDSFVSLFKPRSR